MVLGLRYKLALSIQTGDIIWIHGLFPPGTHTDLTIWVSHTSSNQVREWKLIKFIVIGHGLLTAPTQMHGLYFQCILIITQLYFEIGSCLPQVAYTMLNDEEK